MSGQCSVKYAWDVAVRRDINDAWQPGSRACNKATGAEKQSKFGVKGKGFVEWGDVDRSAPALFRSYMQGRHLGGTERRCAANDIRMGAMIDAPSIMSTCCVGDTGHLVRRAIYIPPDGFHERMAHAWRWSCSCEHASSPLHVHWEPTNQPCPLIVMHRYAVLQSHCVLQRHFLVV